MLTLHGDPRAHSCDPQLVRTRGVSIRHADISGCLSHGVVCFYALNQEGSTLQYIPLSVLCLYSIALIHTPRARLGIAFNRVGPTVLASYCGLS